MVFTKEFLSAVDKLIAHEGGYSNHPSDPGGATNFGITQWAWNAHRESLGLPTFSVKNMTRPDALGFYFAEYWDRMRLQQMPPGIAIHIFDMAVNAGERTGVLLAQRAYNTIRHEDWDALREDGIIGPQTRSALSRAFNLRGKATIACYNGERYNHYAALVKKDGKFRDFIHGWANRIAEMS